MASAMLELRTPVMILVELSWQDQTGMWQTARLRMEDKSAGGACVRSKTPIEVGSKVKIQWRFDQFTGTVKYCRKDDREYLIGIQRGTIDEHVSTLQSADAANPKPLAAPHPNAERMVAEGRHDLRESIDEHAKVAKRKADRISAEFPAKAHAEHREPAPIVSVAEMPSASCVSIAPAEWITLQKTQGLERPQVQARDGPSPTFTAEPTVPRQAALSAKAISKRKGADKERKPMAHKWLRGVPWNHKEDDPGPPTDSSMSDRRSFTAPKEGSMSQSTQSNEKGSGISAREVPVFQVELLPMDDIYRTAGIVSPRKGYSVTKVVEMLSSEHIRTLSRETKRAALLMALDAAGVSIEQVQRDAKSRQGALDAYEAEQKKQAEAEWQRKAEEISHIQAELESIKAHYSSRISRNMEALARDKARFNAWVTTKEQESQSIAEAVDLCIETPISEPSPTPVREISTAAAAGAGSTPTTPSKPL